MGVGQKLPTTISVALAKTLQQYAIDCDDIGTHSTLTSLYGILAMARIHNKTLEPMPKSWPPAVKVKK